jgi:hypothetical protein
MTKLPDLDDIETLADDHIKRIHDLFLMIGHAEQRLLRDLAKTDITHIPVSEYPPERVEAILAAAQEKDEYCKAVLFEADPTRRPSDKIPRFFFTIGGKKHARRERKADETGHAGL